MLATRRELIDDFIAFKGESGDATARDLAERLLNRALLAIYLKHPWRAFNEPDPYLFSTVDGTRLYAMPSYFGRITGRDGQLRDMTTGAVIYPKEPDDLQAEDPLFGTSLETTGRPHRYVLAGQVGVHTQPVAAGDALEVLSSSAADDAALAPVCYIEGLDAAGRYTRTQVTLDGVTPVAIGTWKQVREFGKAYPFGTTATTELTSSAGTVTLRKVTGAVELQLLFADESARQHDMLTLYPTPDGVYSIAVPMMRGLRRVYRDADPMPREWGNALFEEMHIQWDKNRGKLVSDAQVPRPALVDLISWDNAGRVPSAKFRVPFGQTQR